MKAEGRGERKERRGMEQRTELLLNINYYISLKRQIGSD